MVFIQEIWVRLPVALPKDASTATLLKQIQGYEISRFRFYDYKMKVETRLVFLIRKCAELVMHRAVNPAGEIPNCGIVTHLPSHLTAMIEPLKKLRLTSFLILAARQV